MLLKNFQSCFAANGAPVKRMSGNSSNYTFGTTALSYSNGTCHYGGSGSNACHIVIGAGDTAPTWNDYDMADASIMASDKMKSLNQTAVFDAGSGGTVTVQWKNNSSSPITVKEVGLAFKNGSAAYSKDTNYIVARKVLPTPVTIQPDEVYAFTYRVSVKASS